MTDLSYAIAHLRFALNWYEKVEAQTEVFKKHEKPSYEAAIKILEEHQKQEKK